MDYVNDPSELLRRLRRLSFQPKLDEELAEKLQTLPGSEADVLLGGVELLYAYRDKLDDAALTLMGQIFYYADQMNFTTFNRDGRSKALVGLVRRELGEKGTGVAGKKTEWPDPEAERRAGLDWRAPDEDATAAPAAG